jgi:hypothetical protein
MAGLREGKAAGENGRWDRTAQVRSQSGCRKESATRRIFLTSKSRMSSAVVGGDESGPPRRKGPNCVARRHSGGPNRTARGQGERDKGCASAQLVVAEGVAALVDRPRSLQAALRLKLLRVRWSCAGCSCSPSAGFVVQPNEAAAGPDLGPNPGVDLLPFGPPRTGCWAGAQSGPSPAPGEGPATVRGATASRRTPTPRRSG